MKLTTSTSETFMRRLASASAHELQEIVADCKVIATDKEQAAEVRIVAARMASVIRAQLRARAKK